MANTVQVVPGVQFNKLSVSTAALTGFTHEILINYDDPKLKARTTAGNVTYDFEKSPNTAVWVSALYRPEAFVGASVTSVFVRFGLTNDDDAFLTGSDNLVTAANDTVTGTNPATFAELGDSANFRVIVGTAGAGPSALTAGRARILFRLIDLDHFDD